MAEEFMKRGMVSAVESSFWNTLMIEQTAQFEYDQLTQKLAQKGAGFFYGFQRKRWLNRQKQLLASLNTLNTRIGFLEKQIEFIEVPRARNKKWKPRPAT